MNNVIFHICCLFFCFSCTLENKSIANGDGFANNKYPDTVLVNQLVEHYRKENLSDSFDIKNDDTVIECSYYDKAAAVDERNYNGGVFISNDSHNYLHGDLDNDGINEIVCSVSRCNGGNISWNDVCVFKFLNNKFILIAVLPSSELTGDNRVFYYGNFYPIKIEKGLLIGESNCWTKNDAHCCPSLKYNTTVKFKSNKLIFNSRKLSNSQHAD